MMAEQVTGKRGLQIDWLYFSVRSSELSCFIQILLLYKLYVIFFEAFLSMPWYRAFKDIQRIKVNVSMPPGT